MVRKDIKDSRRCPACRPWEVRRSTPSRETPLGRLPGRRKPRATCPQAIPSSLKKGRRTALSRETRMDAPGPPGQEMHYTRGGGCIHRCHRNCPRGGPWDTVAFTCTQCFDPNVIVNANANAVVVTNIFVIAIEHGRFQAKRENDTYWHGVQRVDNRGRELYRIRNMRFSRVWGIYSRCLAEPLWRWY